MLSWSATETAQSIDLPALVDDAAELDLAGGRELIALGRAVRGTQPERRWIDAVAASFEIMNRTVDATGLEVGRHHRQQHQWIVDALGLDRFPHAPD